MNITNKDRLARSEPKQPYEPDLRGVYKHSIQWHQDTFFSMHMEHSKDRLYLGHKTNHNTFLKTEIIQSILSEQNGMKLQVTFTRKSGKPQIRRN